MRSVAITGAGAVSPVGVGMGALEAAVEGTRDGITELVRFSTSEFETHLGATVPGFERAPCEDLAVTYALLAGREALEQARPVCPPHRLALVLGSSLGSGHARLAELTETIGAALGVEGARITISTACTSSSNAVGFAMDLLECQAADVVLAGGSDVLSSELFAGFHALGVLGAAPCAPFSRDFGTTLGEGAGFVVLERTSDVRGNVLGTLLGYGLSCDAYHPTSPDPTGSGITRAIRWALEDAGLDAGRIGYVNAHATGTEANDAAETQGQRAALGASTAPVSGSKSFLGHAQGAAGILELLVTLAALRAQRLPPTLRLRATRRGAPLDAVAESRPHVFDVALSLNSAFAGANSALVIGTSDPERRLATRSQRPVFVSGMAAVAGELSLSQLAERVLAGEVIGRQAGPCALSEVLPKADPRGIDPSTRFVAVACARALQDAGIAVTGDLRDRSGLVAAATTFSTASAREFHQSIEQRGLPRLNATAFAKLVLNAPTGAAARFLSLRGPTSTLTTGQGGGVVAVAYAAELLSRSRSTDVMLGTAFDEIDSDEGAEGAAALVLTPTPRLDRPLVRLASWAIGSPRDGVRATIDRALGALSLREIDVVLSDGHLGLEAARTANLRALWLAPSAVGALACVLASHLVVGGARRVLVATRGGGASAAMVFEGGAA